MCKRQVAPAEMDEGQLEGLVRQARDGDLRAWHRVWLVLAPRIEKVVARRRVAGRLATCADARADIVVHVMGLLRGDDGRRLGELGELLARRDGSYRRWLSRVAINEARMALREHPEYLGHVEGGGHRWATFAPADETLQDERLDPIRAIEARCILARAQERLRPAQRDALLRWLRREDAGEIAGALGLADAAAATRLVRAALDRLRRAYAASEAAPGKGGGEIDQRV